MLYDVCSPAAPCSAQCLKLYPIAANYTRTAAVAASVSGGTHVFEYIFEHIYHERDAVGFYGFVLLRHIKDDDDDDDERIFTQ